MRNLSQQRKKASDTEPKIHGRDQMEFNAFWQYIRQHSERDQLFDRMAAWEDAREWWDEMESFIGIASKELVDDFLHGRLKAEDFRKVVWNYLEEDGEVRPGDVQRIAGRQMGG